MKHEPPAPAGGKVQITTDLARRLYDRLTEDHPGLASELGRALTATCGACGAALPDPSQYRYLWLGEPGHKLVHASVRGGETLCGNPVPGTVHTWGQKTGGPECETCVRALELRGVRPTCPEDYDLAWDRLEERP